MTQDNTTQPADTMNTIPPVTAEYESLHKGNASALALIAGALAILLVLILVFIGSVYTSFKLNGGVIGGLSVMPIFMLIAGIGRLRAQSGIQISEHGLTIVRSRSKLTINWDQISKIRILRDKSISTQQNAGYASNDKKHHELLELVDNSGKRIDIIRSVNFESFEDISRSIEYWSSQSSGVPVRDLNDETKQELKKSRLTAIAMLLFGPLFIAISVFLVLDSYRTQREERAFAQSGDIILAQITDHRMHNGIAPRIEYEFLDQLGDVQSDDVMLEQWYWDQLKGESLLEVVYLPSKPSSHRPLTGKDWSDTMSLRAASILGSLCGTMGLVFFGVGLLTLNGYEISFAENKFKLIRIGEREPKQ